ncbi:MAG TPA: hypothetical protein VI566_03640 [Xanthomonadales bacterium]|nr:hypothetical protein [Xanthomonadales bacterium]
MKTLLRINGFILILCLNVACADSTEEAAQPVAEGATAAAADSTARDSGADATADAAKANGMLMPIDGSSLEAFDASLAEIKKNSTTTDYTTLENAIEYLLVYDLSAKRSRAKLAERLNGQTGQQVIERVESRRN